MKDFFTFLISVSILISCVRQGNIQEQLKISDFEFQSIFGTTQSDEKTTYCLLGSGFFRAPSSDNSDSLIFEWINSHKKAIVIPVSSFGPTEINDPNSKMIFCLVIQGADTLNNFLIKNGCFPGGTMERPKTWDERDNSEKEFYGKIDEKPDVAVLMDNKGYDNFIEQIKKAETFARENKLGIWKQDKDAKNE